MRRTFILHASGAKLPTDLLGLTCVRYADALTPPVLKTVNQKLRKAIEAEGRLARIAGALVAVLATARTGDASSAISLRRVSRDRERRAGGRRPLVAGGRHPLGALLVRAVEGADRPGRGLLLLDRRAAAAPGRAPARGSRRDQARVRGPRQRLLDDRSERVPELHARTSGVYLHADPAYQAVLDGSDQQRRAST